jgi:hypothetical protein
MSDTNNMLIYLQQNVGRSYPHLITLLQNALKSGAHYVLVQEPAYKENGMLITIPAYIPIQPNYIGNLPKVTAYWKKDAPFQYRQLNHLCDNPDVIVLDITNPNLLGITLVNVYNEKRQGERIGIR